MSHAADSRAARRASLRRPFAWLDTGLASFERATLIVGILAMAAISVANVISRNTLGSSIYFANDVAQILLVIVTFMGIGIGAREARHIRVSAIHDLLPAKMRKALLVLVTLTTSGMLLLLANYGWDYAKSTQRTCRVLPEHIDAVFFNLPLGAMPLAAGVLLGLAAMILGGHAIRLIRHQGRRLLQHLGPMMQKLALAGALVAGFLIAAWLFGLFIELVDNRTGRCRVTSSTGFPVYLVHMLVPLGFLLGGIQFFLAGLRNLTSRDNYLSWYRRDEYQDADQAAAQTSASEPSDRQRSDNDGEGRTDG